MEHRDIRPVTWVKAARKAFDQFPIEAQRRVLQALSIAAEGRKADIAKPMKQMGSGVFEIALPYRGDAYRVVYTVQIGTEIWVIHAFQKKSKKGVATPKTEMDVIRERLKRLKEQIQ